MLEGAAARLRGGAVTPPANHTVNGNADAADALLTVENLSVHFIRSGGLARRGLVVRAVDGVSFRVRGGATFGIVGESGSGKSALARALLGLIRASAGRVLFDGVNVLAARRGPLMRLRRRMQIVFQDPQASLNPRLPVKTIVGEALHVHGLARTGREAAERVADVLRAVGLSPDDMHRYPQQFSGGQRQRIGISTGSSRSPRRIRIPGLLSCGPSSAGPWRTSRASTTPPPLFSSLCWYGRRQKPGTAVFFVRSKPPLCLRGIRKGKKNDSLDKDTLLQPPGQLPHLSERSDCED